MERYHTIKVGKSFLEYRLGTGDTCEICDIEVDNLRRRTGVGRYLLETLKGQLQAIAPSTVTVYAFCRTENQIAKEWYSAMGFCVYPVPEFYGKGHNAYCCTLLVQKSA